MIRVSRVPAILGLMSLAALPALGGSHMDALLEQVLWLEEQAGLVKSIEVEFTHTQQVPSPNGQSHGYSRNLPADPPALQPRGQVRVAPADELARRRQLDIEQQLVDQLRERQLAQQQQRQQTQQQLQQQEQLKRQQTQQQLQQQEQLKRQQQVVEQSQVAAQAKRKEWERIPAARTDERKQAEAEYNELAQTLARELETLKLLEQQQGAGDAVMIMAAPGGGRVIIRGQAAAGGQMVLKGGGNIPTWMNQRTHPQNYRATWHRQGNKVRQEWTTHGGSQAGRTTTWAFDGQTMMTQENLPSAQPRVNLTHPDPSLFMGRTQPYEFAFELNGFPLAQLIRLAPWREVSQGDYQGQQRLDVLLEHPTNPLRRVLLSFDGEHRLTSREIYLREGEGFRLDERHEFAGYEPHDSGTDTPIWYPTQITMHHFPSVFANSAEITKATITIQRVVFNEELPEERFVINVPAEVGIYDARTQQWIRFPKRVPAAQAPEAPNPPAAAGNKPPGMPPNLQVVPVPKGEELAPVEPVPSTVRDLVWRPKPGERVERLLPLRPVDGWTGRR